MTTYSIFIVQAIFPQNRAGNENKLNMFSAPPPPPTPPRQKKKKTLGKVTILWLGIENEFWLESTRLRLIANFNYYICYSNAISVSDSSAHFVAESLH